MAKARKKVRKKQEKKPTSEVRISEIPGQVSLERSPFRLKGNIRYLSTDIDSLYSFITEQKRIRLSDAARKFRVSKEVIEEWGKILEDHHMIDMHYPVTGEPILGIPMPKKGKKAKIKEPKKIKPPKPKRRIRPKFTKKRILMMAEIVILGELLIYIFVVNQQLRDNFLPTLFYQIGNIPKFIMNLPDMLRGTNLLINPLYFVIAILIVAFWIVAVVVHKSKKKAEAKKT